MGTRGWGKFCMGRLIILLLGPAWRSVNVFHYAWRYVEQFSMFSWPEGMVFVFNSRSVVSRIGVKFNSLILPSKYLTHFLSGVRSKSASFHFGNYSKYAFPFVQPQVFSCPVCHVDRRRWRCIHNLFGNVIEESTRWPLFCWGRIPFYASP